MYLVYLFVICKFMYMPKKMAERTQDEGKTERTNEPHDRCSELLGMCMPKTADLRHLRHS